MTMTSRPALYEDAPWAIERFIGSGGREPLVTSAALDKFFVLTSKGHQPLAMISKNVDLLWHTLIEHTELYPSLCLSRYGRVIHHRPRSTAFPLPAAAVRNFYSLWEAQVGEVGPEWESDAEPELVNFGRGIVDQEPANVRWSGWPGHSPNLWEAPGIFGG